MGVECRYVRARGALLRLLFDDPFAHFRGGPIREGDGQDSLRINSVPSFFTAPMLRAEFDWDHLRADPEFKALLADPKNGAPL